MAITKQKDLSADDGVHFSLASPIIAKRAIKIDAIVNLVVQGNFKKSVQKHKNLNVRNHYKMSMEERKKVFREIQNKINKHAQEISVENVFK